MNDDTEHYGPTGEYSQNLYSDAMGCVRNAGGTNVYPADEYPNGIPVADVRKMFAEHEHAAYVNTFHVPNASDDLPGEDIETGLMSWVRKYDYREHARYAPDSADKRRQSSWLLDTYASELVGGADGLKIVAAGHTNRGGRVYLQLATSQILSVAGMDVAPTLFVFHSHDGTLPVGANFRAQVLACANAVASMAAGGKARSKQTKNITDAGMLARHKAILGLDALSEGIEESISRMSDTVFTESNWSALLGELLPTDGENISKHAVTRNERVRETLTGMWRTDERCAPWHGTVLGAVQTLDTYDSHERGVRNDTNRYERMVNDALGDTLARRQASRIVAVDNVLTAAAA